MIKSIRLVNFFSFRDATIELRPNINVLIGVNGSGKSNVFKAIRLLKEAVAGVGLEKLILNEWGRFDNICFAGNGGAETFTALDAERLKKDFPDFKRLIETLESNQP